MDNYVLYNGIVNVEFTFLFVLLKNKYIVILL